MAPDIDKTDGFIPAITNSRRGVWDGLKSVVITKSDAEVAADPTAQ